MPFARNAGEAAMDAQPHADYDDIALEIRCPSDSRMLSLIRRIVVDVAEEMGFGDEDCIKIEIAVDEACANIVEHAYGPPMEPEARKRGVRIVIGQGDGSLRITVVDFGLGAAATHVGVSSLEEYLQGEQPRGLGLYVMDQLMDEVRFRFPPQLGTEVTLVKNLRDSAPSPS
jgi:serine/threonine-protein kinase RsbW